MLDISQFYPNGLATGIGSIPFTEPNVAIKLIWKYLPEIPHWFQMPRRGMEEHFVFQCLQPLVKSGLLVKKNKDTYFFDTSLTDWADRLTDFYTISLLAEAGDTDALENFIPPKHAARGFHLFLDEMKKNSTEGIRFLKGQLVGPLTVGLQIKDEEGRFAYYHGDLRDLIVRTLALNARSQVIALSQFGVPAMIFIDEPAISAYGSAHYLPLTREMILEDLNMICRAVLSENAMVGLHSCEAIDWSLLFESEVQIVSLDAYRYGDSLFYYVPQMKDFLERHGIIAWGIVPTLDDPFAEDTDTLLNRLQRLFSELIHRGMEPKLLFQQSMITPSCGTGLLSVEQAERIYELTSALSKKVIAMAS